MHSACDFMSFGSVEYALSADGFPNNMSSLDTAGHVRSVKYMFTALNTCSQCHVILIDSA